MTASAIPAIYFAKCLCGGDGLCRNYLPMFVEGRPDELRRLKTYSKLRWTLRGATRASGKVEPTAGNPGRFSSIPAAKPDRPCRRRSVAHPSPGRTSLYESRI